MFVLFFAVFPAILSENDRGHNDLLMDDMYQGEIILN